MNCVGRARRIVPGAAVAALTLAGAGGAAGSIWVTSGAVRPALRIDARGNAEVSWSAGTARKRQLVPLTGRVLPRGGLPGADVSRAAPRSIVPLARVVRRTPDGWLWALQEWSPVVGEPPELHLARWKGPPTELTLMVDGERLVGRATFQGQGVAGFTTTPEGKRLRIYVYLDCSGCPGAGSGWKRMIAIAPRADGSFRVFLRPEWKGSRYRATVVGPNRGTTRAPDAQATAT